MIGFLILMLKELDVLAKGFEGRGVDDVLAD